MTCFRSAIIAVALFCCSQSVAAGAPADPFEVPGTPIELGQGYDFESTIYAGTRRINILVPDGYNDPAQAGVKYPVLYLLDGGDGWQDFTHIAAMVQQGGRWGANAPVIVVGIESKDRRAEFTKPSRNSAEVRDFPTHGGADKFRQFIIGELKPAIARRYRVTDEDAIMGESLAALFVADLALRHGSDFRHFIAVDPSLWWDDGRLSQDAMSLLAASSQVDQSLWLSMADEGGAMQEGMDRLVAALREKASPRIRWRYTPYPQEKHSTVYHIAATRAVRETFPAPPPPE